MTPQTSEWVKRFAGQQIAVLGDLMMDEYVWGQAKRVSPESPVLVVEVDRETSVPGGAANVAANLMALGAKVSVFGAVGDDPQGAELRQTLADHGADTSGVVTDPSRRTTRKTRVLAQNQQVVRIDREDTRPLSASCSSAVAGALVERLGSVAAVLVSDYAKGVVNPLTVPPIVTAAMTVGRPVVVNAKPDNAACLRGATLVTLNVSEAVAASGDKSFHDPDHIEAAGRELKDKLGVETLVVTRGPDGLAVWGEDRECVRVPAHAVEVYDVAGAGDTVVSVLALATAVGAPIEVAARLAAAAAAVVVGKVGVATASPDEVLHRLAVDWPTHLN